MKYDRILRNFYQALVLLFVCTLWITSGRTILSTLFGAVAFGFSFYNLFVKASNLVRIVPIGSQSNRPAGIKLFFVVLRRVLEFFAPAALILIAITKLREPAFVFLGLLLGFLSAIISLWKFTREGFSAEGPAKK